MPPAPLRRDPPVLLPPPLLLLPDDLPPLPDPLDDLPPLPDALDALPDPLAVPDPGALPPVLPPLQLPIDDPDEPEVVAPLIPRDGPYCFFDDGATCTVAGPAREKVPEEVQACPEAFIDETVEGEGVRDVYLRFTDVPDGQPPMHPPGSPDNEALARDWAVWLVQQTRHLLPNGPYNNRGHLPDLVKDRAPHPRTEDARADFIFNDGTDQLDDEQRVFKRFGSPDPPQVLGDADHLFDLDQLETMPCTSMRQLALLSASTRKLQGGVCEKLASVVLGLFSQHGPPGAQACKIAWDGDHHYVVLRIGDSQWWVADPWPNSAHVLPWTHNYFAPENTLRYTQMDLVYPVAHAFGVPMLEDEIDRSLAFATRCLPYTPHDGAFDHNWGQQDNLPTAAQLQHLPPVFEDVVAAGPDEWG